MNKNMSKSQKMFLLELKKQNKKILRHISKTMIFLLYDRSSIREKCRTITFFGVTPKNYILKVKILLRVMINEVKGNIVWSF